jgi:hypothetical protein
VNVVQVWDFSQPCRIPGRDGSRALSIAFALWFACVAPPLRAAQPLVTDDAAVVSYKACQLEAWIVATHGAREYWAQPACNFTGDLELTVGGARTDPSNEPSSSAVLLQAKWVPFSREEDRKWSFGLVGGAARDTHAPHGSSAYQAYYAKLLASWYPRDDLEVDLNLGMANVYGSGSFALAGAAIQYAIVPALQLLAEVFHDEPGPVRFQGGVRWIVAPERFEAYASYGKRFSLSSDSWSVVVGVRLQTPAFLP